MNDKNDYRGILAGLESITGKKAMNSELMTVKNYYNHDSDFEDSNDRSKRQIRLRAFRALLYCSSLGRNYSAMDGPTIPRKKSHQTPADGSADVTISRVPRTRSLNSD